MIKKSTILFGVIFILIGLLGFTSNAFIGENALFVSNNASNWLHLIAGIALCAAGWYA